MVTFSSCICGFGCGWLTGREAPCDSSLSVPLTLIGCDRVCSARDLAMSGLAMALPVALAGAGRCCSPALLTSVTGILRDLDRVRAD